jgi:hypothetical protein
VKMNNQKENSPLILSDISQSEDLPINEYQIYTRRWYILTMYTAIALICEMDINTWGPIAEP